MTTYKRKINPFNGKLQKVLDANLLKIKGAIDTVNDLPLSGNVENDCYIIKDTDRLYTWNSVESSGTIDKWVDVGSSASVDWSAITNKPTSTVSDIDDAVSHKNITSGNPHEVNLEDIEYLSDMVEFEDNIVTLLHFDGAEGSKVAEDVSFNKFSIDMGGDAIITTNNPKWGIGCLTQSVDSVNRTRIGTSGADFKFMHGGLDPINFAFTVKFWFRTNTPRTGNNQHFFRTGSPSSSSVGVCAYYLNTVGNEGKLEMVISRGQTGWIVVVNTGEVRYPNDTDWHYLEFSYDHQLASNNGKIFIDGVLSGQGTKTGNSPSSANATNPLLISYDQANHGINGAIDEFVVKNIAEHIDSFTPPNGPFSVYNLTKLDKGGSNEVHAVDIKDAISKKHAQNTDTKLDEYGDYEISAENLTKGNIQFIIDSGGAEIATGIKGDIQIPFNCIIEEAILLADQSGSIVIDIWKDTYTNYKPTDADSITSATPLTITAAIKSSDSTLTGWNVNVNEGDILTFNVDSCTTIERCTVILKVKRI